MPEKMDYKRLPVSEECRSKLKTIKQPGESYSKAIERLINATHDHLLLPIECATGQKVDQKADQKVVNDPSSNISEETKKTEEFLSLLGLTRDDIKGFIGDVVKKEVKNSQVPGDKRFDFTAVTKSLLWVVAAILTLIVTLASIFGFVRWLVI